MKKLTILFILIFPILSIASEKIAVLDFNLVYMAHPEYNKYEDTLLQISNENQKKLEEKENEYIEFIAKNGENKDKQIELITLKNELQEEIDKKEEEIFNKLSKSINEKLKIYNKKKKYSLIIDKWNGVLLFDEKIDITVEFIEYLKSN